MARPSDYSEELAIEIAARSAEGQSLKTICQDEAMPSVRSVFRWRNLHPEFDRMLMRAHVDKADTLFEESIDISDEPVADMAQATRNRLRVQARQHAAARLRPDKYAEKIGIGHAQGMSPLLPEQRSTTDDIDLARRVCFVFHEGMKELKSPTPRITNLKTFLDLASLVKQALDIAEKRRNEPPPQLSYQPIEEAK